MIAFLAKLVIVVVSLLCFVGCKNLSLENFLVQQAMTDQQMTLEIFNRPEVMLKERATADISAFQKHKGEEISDSYKFTRLDGVVVLQQEIGDKIHEFLTFPGSPFEYVNIYDLQGTLKYKASRFYSPLIGYQIELKPNGSIIEKKDMYGNHKITVEQLRDIIKKELNKDIYDLKQTNDVLSGEMGESRQPFYEVRLYKTDSSAPQLEIYLVDGRTGDILYNIQGMRYLLDPPRGKNKPKQIVDEYQRHQKERE